MTRKAIVFDLDDTLVATSRANTASRTDALKALADMCGFELQQNHLKIEKQLYKAFRWARMPDLWRAICREINVEPPGNGELKKLQVSYENQFLQNLQPFDTVVDAMGKIEQRGLLTAVISDGDEKWQWRKLKTTNLDRFLNPVTVRIAIQSDLQHAKPSTTNFRWIQEFYHLEPEDCMYVGDKPWDVLAANTSGWHSVRTMQAAADREEYWPESGLLIEKPDHTITCFSDILDIL